MRGVNRGRGGGWGGGRRARGELLLICPIWGGGGGIAGSGVMRYLITWMAVPAYFSNASNGWDAAVVRHLPDWLVLSRDPNHPAIRWFMEGLPRGAHIPWGVWAVPLTVWIAFVVLLYASNFSFVALFFRPWSSGERLVFPLVHVPELLAEEAAPGRALNAFLRNPLTWAGCVLAAGVWSVNGLAAFLPAVPRIPMGTTMGSLFPDRPWSEFSLGTLNGSFIVIGLTFLLATQTSLSLWVFYLLYQLSYVWIAWLGSGATGFWGDWYVKVTTFETAGALLALAAFLCWTARGFLAAWWARARAGRADPELDPIAPRPALGLMLAGVAGMILWLHVAGAAWWAAAAAVLLFLAMLLVLARVVAEAGLLFVQISVIPYDVIAGLVPPAWLGGATLNALNMQKAILMQDLREALLPYLFNGLAAADRARLPLGRVLAVLALAAAVGLGVSGWSRIVTSYKYGAVNMDQWAAIGSPLEFLGAVSTYQSTPPDFDFVTVGGAKLLPVNAAHVLAGGGLALGLLALRARFLWWPLHPFGLVLCGSWAMSVIWFSIFLGWATKTAVMTFGGAPAYRRVLPFVLGLVLGESLAAALWILVGLATGIPSGVNVLRS